MNVKPVKYIHHMFFFILKAVGNMTAKEAVSTMVQDDVLDVLEQGDQIYQSL